MQDSGDKRQVNAFPSQLAIGAASLPSRQAPQDNQARLEAIRRVGVEDCF